MSSMKPMSAPEPAAPSQGTFLGLAVRLYWIAIGNLPIIYLPIHIMQEKIPLLHPMDFLFWLSVLSVIAVRYLDVVRLGGKTTYNEPATLADWKRHALILTGVAAALFLLAHGWAGFSA